MDVDKSYLDEKMVIVSVELPEKVYLELYKIYNVVYMNPSDPIYNRHTPTLEFFMGFLTAYGMQYFRDTQGN